MEVAARLAEQGYGVTVVDPRWVRPVPAELVELAAGHRLVVSVEDGVRTGGVGDALAQALRDADVRVPLRDLGVPADWHPHGTRDEILADLGLTAQDVARNVTGWISGLDATPDRLDPPADAAAQEAETDRQASPGPPQPRAPRPALRSRSPLPAPRALRLRPDVAQVSQGGTVR